jgi:prevent-host-death family protein
VFFFNNLSGAINKLAEILLVKLGKILYNRLGGVNMIITATEFKNRVGEYLEIAQREEVIISRNGKNIAKLVAIGEKEYPATKSLTGVFEKAASYDLEQAKAERLKKYENID